jgi:hypothetical protein
MAWFRDKKACYFIAFLLFTIFIGCKKEKTAGTQTTYDSIALKYTLEPPPGAAAIDLDGDGKYVIKFSDSVWYYHLQLENKILNWLP